MQVILKCNFFTNNETQSDIAFQISSAYQQHEFFYRSSAKLAEKFSGVKGETQSVRVYKDGKSYKFVDNDR